MARDQVRESLSGQILDEAFELSLAELCRACRLPAERVVELVEHGIIEPAGRAQGEWRFRAVSIRRVRSAQRLSQDLGVNIAGVALALDLLDELDQLRARLQRLDDFPDQDP